MENASKALLMAAGILISIIIIGLVVIMFSNLRQSQSETELEKEIMQITKYNQKFEQFNRTILYGSDIVSIINLAEDYNKVQAREDIGYTPITININIKTPISLVQSSDDKNYKRYIIRSGKHVISKNSSGDNIKTTMKLIDNEIQKIENTYNQKGKAIDTLIKLKQKYDSEIQTYKYTTNRQTEAQKLEEQYKKELQPYGGKDAVEKDIRRYTALNTTITDFRTKYFTCTNTQYDNSGRMILIEFNEESPN